MSTKYPTFPRHMANPNRIGGSLAYKNLYFGLKRNDIDLIYDALGRHVDDRIRQWTEDEIYRRLHILGLALNAPQ